jgi:pyrroline-5-carboxylate reductase
MPLLYLSVQAIVQIVFVAVRPQRMAGTLEGSDSEDTLYKVFVVSIA